MLDRINDLLNTDRGYQLRKAVDRVSHGFQYGLGFGLSFALLKLLGII